MTQNAVIDTRELLTPVAKLGLSFEELSDKAHAIQNKCKDFNISNASFNNIRFDGDSGQLIYVPDETSTPRRVPMSKHSMSQLCNKIGVPVRYMDKCLDSGMTDLATENINSWLQDFGKNLFVREHDSRARGILSDRYMALDTPDILDVLGEVIDPHEYSTKGFFLTEERFHARIVQNHMMRVDNEDLFAGVQVDSSDVGRSTLIVRFFIFKQVCTNGLCISKGGGILFEQRHVGISLDDFRSEFKTSMSRIPDLITNAADMIELGRKEKVNLLSENDLTAFTDRLKLTTKLSDEAMGKVINLMQERYSTTRWGLVNSLTEVAQDYTLERRLELEKIAGEILVGKAA